MRTQFLLAALLVAPAVASGQAVKADTAFHAMQMRGKLVMGVDQYKSKHRFEDRADGGRIELQLEQNDAEGVTVIRNHLKTIADAFAAGDFTAPALVHMKTVPGAAVMAERRALIQYRYKQLPRGGEVLITTRDAAARSAIREFLAFQRSEHHAH